MGILGHQLLILTTCMMLRRTNKIYVVLGLSPVFWVYLWLFGRSIDPAEVGQDQSRVGGGDTGPSVAYASTILVKRFCTSLFVYISALEH